MPRPIDADALKDVIQQHDYPLADRLNSIDTGMFTLGIFQAIDEQPTLSPDDVRGVGKWEEIEVMPKAYDLYGVQTWARKMRCCNCRFVTFAIEGHFGQYIYCPNCGAKMEVTADA